MLVLNMDVNVSSKSEEFKLKRNTNLVQAGVETHSQRLQLLLQNPTAAFHVQETMPKSAVLVTG